VKAFAYAERWGHEEVVVYRDPVSALQVVV